MNKNNRSTVGVLFRVYSDWLLAFTAKKFGLEGADDTSQQAYLKLHEAQFLVVRHPQAFLKTIATNVAYDQRRRAMARGGGLAVSLEDAEGDMGLSVAADQEQAFLLKQIILSMPALYRDVFLLSRFSGLSYEEIARRCDVSVKTVEWRMSKALAHCAALLRDD